MNSRAMIWWLTVIESLDPDGGKDLLRLPVSQPNGDHGRISGRYWYGGRAPDLRFVEYFIPPRSHCATALAIALITRR